MFNKTTVEIIDSMDQVIEKQQHLIKILRQALLQYMSLEEIENLEKTEDTE